MFKPGKAYLALFVSLSVCFSGSLSASSHAELIELFQEWRIFEQPPWLDGAPDYTAASMARRHAELKSYQARLQAMDLSAWPVEQQVDWHLVRAEMNGMDFNIRVLQSWARDPAFYQSVWTYQSDTPAHEGPTHHALVELWTYEFPLDAAGEKKLAAELATIPPLLQQARINLTGNARDLWVAGIKNIDDQVGDLEQLAADAAEAGPQLQAALSEALAATRAFAGWLREQEPEKTGPSGIGKDNYTWYLNNVHLVPLTWEDEVRLLKRELDRAHASLKLEEHRNRDLPPLVPIATAEEWAERAEASVSRFARFLVEEEVLPAYGYIEPVLRQYSGAFAPPESRNFFQTVVHHEPLALWSHWYHWFDHAHMRSYPHESPIRRGALLYNIFDSRSEGNATGFEEMVMHAGLYDDTPRSREIVWIMLAQRAARGLGSLYAHANVFTMQEARDFHVKWTPRGWMREDLDLLGFEQQLYLRQPGYGTSYITGKYLMEQLLSERTRQVNGPYPLKDFFAEVDGAGVIPVALIRWQLTGLDDEIQAMMRSE
jgi:hypothetical protein